MLESLLNEIAGSESNAGVDMKYFSSLYSAINGEMSSAMMIRDDQVEPDVESFRCLSVSCDVRSRDKAGSIWMVFSNIPSAMGPGGCCRQTVRETALLPAAFF